VVNDVAGDHVSKGQESTGGYFGAQHCYILSDSIKWLCELPSSFEHEVLDRFPVVQWYPIVSWRASKPSPRLRHHVVFLQWALPHLLILIRSRRRRGQNWEEATGLSSVTLPSSSIPTSFDLAPLALVSGRGAGGEGFCTVF
jgi:hypothetical protein